MEADTKIAAPKSGRLSFL